MTQERKELLTKILNEDPERGKKLAALKANEALLQINALGYNFTLEELKAYGETVRAAQAEELKMNELDEVAGGGGISITWGIITIGW